MTDREDLKAKLRAKLEMSKIGRLPKDAKEDRIENLKQKITNVLKDVHGSPMDISLHTSP